MSEAAPRVDLRPDQLEIVQDILRRHLPWRRVVAFGSRATWMAKEYSDLDLAILGDEPVPLDAVAALADGFSESDLPFKVDVAIWGDLDDRMRAAIWRDGVDVQLPDAGTHGSNAPIPRPGECSFGSLFAEPTRNGLTRPKAVRGSGVKMVNMGELFAHDRLNGVAMDRVPLDESKESRFLLRDGDLLFARQSLVLEGAGKCSIFLTDNEPTTFESHVIRVRLNRTCADPRYYYYFWRSHLGRSAIRSIVEQGAGASGIRASDLATLPVLAPPIAEQQAIAHILGTLDDKIELNRRMNETLEAMARALFKSWFVDFAPVRAKMEGRDTGLPPQTAGLFPRTLGVDGKPTGWRDTRLTEIASLTKGRSYKSAELSQSDVALVTLKSFERGGGYRSVGLKPYTGRFKPEQVINPGELVIALTDVTQVAEVIGTPAIVPEEDEYKTLVASLDVGIIRPLPNRVSTVFLHNLLLTGRFRAHIRAYCTGTTVLHLGKQALPSYVVQLPPRELLAAFDRIAEPLVLRLNRSWAESKALTRLRDALLPKLISGEVRVQKAEDAVL